MIRKLLLLLILAFMIISCSRQNQNVSENDKNAPKTNLERKSVLEEFLLETNNDNVKKENSELKKTYIPLSYYTEDGYIAHVCVEHAEVKSEPDFNSDTIKILNYCDGFYIRQCWYSKDGEGFWCSYGGDEKKETGWIFSKNLNLDKDINISTVETNGLIREQGSNYHLLTGITKRYGYLLKDNEWSFPLQENEEHELIIEVIRGQHRGACFDPIGIYKFNNITNELIPVSYTIYIQDFDAI